MLFKVTLLLSATFALSQAFVVPEGTSNGVYVHGINEDGSESMTRVQDLAELPSSLKHHASSAKFRRWALPAGRSGCTTSVLNPDDLANAQYSLENYCEGEGSAGSADVPSKHHVTFVSNGAVAYVCNYGKKNICTPSEAQAAYASLGGDCGNPSAPLGGW